MKTGLFDHALLAEALCLREIGNLRNVKDNFNIDYGRGLAMIRHGSNKKTGGLRTEVSFNVEMCVPSSAN